MGDAWSRLSEREQGGYLAVLILCGFFGFLLAFTSIGGKIVGPGRYPDMVWKVGFFVAIVFAGVEIAMAAPPRWMRYSAALLLPLTILASRIAAIWAYGPEHVLRPAGLAFEAGLWLLVTWTAVRSWRQIARGNATEPPRAA